MAPTGVAIQGSLTAPVARSNVVVIVCRPSITEAGAATSGSPTSPRSPVCAFDCDMDSVRDGACRFVRPGGRSSSETCRAPGEVDDAQPSPQPLAPVHTSIAPPNRAGLVEHDEPGTHPARG